MDESFVLQTIGRLYLDNLRLQLMVKDAATKDAQLLELRRQLDELQRAAINESNRKS